MEKVTYYISTGADEKLYTLRQTWQEATYTKNYETGAVTPSGSKTRDYYLMNLGNDLEECKQKAINYCKENDIPLENLITDTDIKLGDITKSKIDHTVFDFGKYVGEKIEDILKTDPDYLDWYFSQIANQSSHKTHAKVVGEIIGRTPEEELQRQTDNKNNNDKEYEERIALAKKNSEYFGVIGDKYENIPVIFKSSSSFEREAYSGKGMETVYVYNFQGVDGDGNPNNRFTWFTASVNFEAPEPNTKIILNFKVKQHNEYQEYKKTIINYVKKV